LKKNYQLVINKDLKQTYETYGFIDNFTTHSFRVGYITKLLKTIPLKQVADIIGHKDMIFTVTYRRYNIDKDFITQQLEKPFQSE
jgi:integrase